MRIPGMLFRRGGSWDIESVAPPWGDRTALYDRICSVRDGDGPDPSDPSSFALPDDDKVTRSGGLPWAPGAMDGVLSHHDDGASDDASADVILESVAEVLSDCSDGRVWRLYGELGERRALEYVDSLVRALAADDTLPEDRLYRLGRWLAIEGADREPVKAGLAILGLFRSDEGRDILMRMGRHDELSLYAGVALSNSAEDGEGAVWELAQAVHGWGRIQLVERLLDTDDDRIKAWLLREGYRNTVLIDYLAYACATAGNLRDALDQPTATADAELLSGAGDLILALLDARQDGTAGCIDDYDDGGEVAEHYVRHVTAPRERRAAGAAPPGVREFDVVGRIAEYVDDPAADWEDRAARGWTAERRARLRASTDELLGRPCWADLIRQGLQSDDRGEFLVAAEAAPRAGIDPWDRWFDKLKDGEDTWVRVVQTERADRMDRVLAIARTRLPPDTLATGPRRLLGLRIETHLPHAAHLCLLGGLSRFPGKGADYVIAGLRSPVVEVRMRAVDVLSEWPEGDWPAGAREWLRDEGPTEADEDLRAHMAGLLR